MTTILVVDDDHSLSRALSKGLGAHGYGVVTAMTAHEAISLAAKTYPHLIMVDLGLPQFTGIEVISAVRGWSSSPIIVTSTRAQETQKTAALQAGADDFLMKPFGINELLARIRAGLRRGAPLGEEAVVTAGDLSIDFGSRHVLCRGEAVDLSPKEWAILAELTRLHGDVVSEQELLDRLWGPGYHGESAHLKTVVEGLREKLGVEPEAPSRLVYEAGVGYRFDVD
ncbi:MAG TPA: response regulator [Acidimicrobiales bacterium]|jgi:two-component system KDP operon response regulator KdpE|nr:response regulator [Acidimicrobiales bacterium]